MLFLFASITGHYQRQGHGLGGPFGLTYVAILTTSIQGEIITRTRHSAVFCVSECLTVTAGAFSFDPSCLRFNGFCLKEITMPNKESYFTYYQGDCLLVLRTKMYASEK